MLKKARLVGKVRKQKEKSLLRKFIEVAWEQGQRRKAMQLLKKQEWSIDFLTSLLVRASRIRSQDLQLTITAPSGESLTILSQNPRPSSASLDFSDDIFNHLDEPDVVDEYIRRNGK